MNLCMVKCVEDVVFLCINQFVEDVGLMVYLVCFDLFIEIFNFYILIVYEKGLEVVWMIYILFGVEGFCKGLDLYFQCYDGQVVICDDFVKVMEDVNGVDLIQFKCWYSQFGILCLVVEGEYDVVVCCYILMVCQSCLLIFGQLSKEFFVILLELGLFDGQGYEFLLCLEGEVVVQGGNCVLVVIEVEQCFVFVEVLEQLLLLLLCGFFVLVKLSFFYSCDQLLFFMQYDSDGFNCWEVG